MSLAPTLASLLARTEPRQLPGVTSPCWEWTGGKWGSTQYGAVDIDPVNGKRRRARVHRLVYQLTRGPIHDGRYVLHHCDNPICCRPSHLWIGTAGDNQQDRRKKGRGYKALTADKARAIRTKRAAGKTIAALADEYGVTHRTIWCVVHRHTWKNA
jgi:hypothetical protein